LFFFASGFSRWPSGRFVVRGSALRRRFAGSAEMAQPVPGQPRPGIFQENLSNVT
jgi:hypothetical protein